MTTNYHTAISVGAAANAATFNAPLGTLDAAITNAQSSVYNVLAYGADNTGAAATHTHIQAAIDACAAAGGGEVFLPEGTYKLTATLTLPLNSNVAITLRGAGANRIGTSATILSVAHTGDGITAVSSVYQLPTYCLRDLCIVGPDTEAPRTTTSGNGIKISGTAVPRLLMTNVFVGFFYGASGLWMDNCEDGTLQDCWFNWNKYGLRMTTAINAYTFVNVSAEYASTIGIWWDGATSGNGAGQSQAWIGGLVQSNEKTGLLINGLTNSAFIGMHFENNNSTNSASDYPIYLKATSTNSNQHIRFANITMTGRGGSTHDDDYIYATGVSGYVNYDIIIDSCMFSGGADTAPIIHQADSWSDGWRIINTTSLAYMTLNSGLRNIVVFHGQVEGVDQLNMAGSVHVPFGSMLDLTDSSSGVLHNSTIDGPEFRGFTGFIWKTGSEGATERMHLTGAALKLTTITLNGNGLELPHIINKTASANVRNSHDAEATTDAEVLTKLKTITIINGLLGQQRFLFDIKADGTNTATAEVQRNGVKIGATQNSTNAVYETKSQDITQDWNPGDTCELWLKCDGTLATAYVQNFRIAYDDSPVVAVVSANT